MFSKKYLMTTRPKMGLMDVNARPDRALGVVCAAFCPVLRVHWAFK